MKQTFYIFAFTFGLFSANSRLEKLNDRHSTLIPDDTISQRQTIVRDSIYKIGDILFEGKKNAKFEFVKKGEKPKNKIKGDTLYVDNDLILLGDINEITSPGIYKKFKFKSQFHDFKTERIYKEKLAKPNFLTDRHAKRFITRIKDGCENTGVNFAGHYTIVEWGCGALCQELAIVDRITGEIIFSQIPFDTIDGHSGSEYRINSRMLIINTEPLSEFSEYEPGYKLYDHWRTPAVYEIKDGRLKQIE